MAAKDSTTAELSATQFTRPMERARIGTAVDDSIPRRQPNEPLQLSFAQERFWLLQQISPESTADLIPIFLRLKGQLNITALERALNEIRRRHETLRTTFAIENELPVQVIAPFIPLELETANLTIEKSSEVEEVLRQTLADEACGSLDFAGGALFHTKLFRLDAEDHALLILVHHIIWDGWSLGIFSRELSTLYAAYCRNEPALLPELSIQYADFALWQRRQMQGPSLKNELAYWKRQLAGAPPVLALPVDRARPAIQSHAGKQHGFTLSRQLETRLVEIARAERATLYMTLLTAFAAFLFRHTNEPDILIGSPIAGRTHPQLESLIGSFVNTLVMRVDCSGDPSFRQLLSRVREVCFDAFDHQEVPFEKVVEALSPERTLSYAPLFQVLFALQNMPRETLRMGEVEVTLYALDLGASQFDLSLLMKEVKSGLEGGAVYNTDLFEDETIEHLCDRWKRFLEGIAQNPEANISRLPVLTEAETQRLLYDWNPAATHAVESDCLHHFFEAQARRTPESIAVVFGDEELSYRELNRRANQLAHYLRGCGVGPEERVGILLERSIEMVVALLGVLKAGAAYVPLDPTYPDSRLAFMLDDCKARVLLTETPLLDGRLLNSSVRTVCLDQRRAEIMREAPDDPAVKVSGDNLIYVIYTSGSTGRPKGAAVTHRGFVNLVNWFVSEFGLTASEKVLIVSSFSFDLTQKDIFAPLMLGGQLHFPTSAFYDATEIVETVSEQEITLINCTPSAFYALLDEVGPGFQKLASLKHVFLGGEPINISRLQEWTSTSDLNAEIVNTYGPTECTDVCASFQLTNFDHSTAPPIGKPIAQTQAYILDSHYELVPTGVTGELFLGGVGLARGYLDQPALTAERFVPHPFSSQAGARLYRTGDLARWLPDGQIDFQGRKDHQIKLRGYRIELGEIETALRAHSGIADAAVLVRNRSNNGSLIAYLIGNGPATVADAELREYLKSSLPQYMIPQFFIWLSEFPLTASGKLDRQSLPDPDLTLKVTDQANARSLTPLESVVASVWADVLQIEKIYVDQNFFELGGHSLLGMQVTNRLKKTLDIDLPLQAIFEAPTIETFCRYLITRRLAAPENGKITTTEAPKDERFSGADILPASPIVPVKRTGDLRMSIQQEAGYLSSQWTQFLVLATALSARSKAFHKSASAILGILTRLNKLRRRKQRRRPDGEALSPLINRNRARLQKLIGSAANWLIPNAAASAGKKRRLIHTVMSWDGPLDIVVLQKALDEIVRRHEALRTTFSTHNGRPVQNLLPSLTIPVKVIPLDDITVVEQEDQLEKILTEEIEKPFDLAQGPLLRLSLVRLSPDQHVGCVVIHHFVSDGVSLGIFDYELRVLYDCFLRNEPSPLPELTIQFADFAHWQREWLQGDTVDRMVAFWKQHLEGVGLLPELELPFAKPRPAVTSYRTATEALPLPDHLTASLKTLSFQQRVTMYMLFLTALKALLHHYTRKEYIGVMTPFGNRIRPGTESLIGWIQHTLILNTRIKGNPTFTELLAQVRDDCFQTYQYQELPYSIMFRELLPQQGNHELLLKLPRMPYVFFDYENRRPSPEVTSLSIRLRQRKSPITTSAPGIAVRLVEYKGKVVPQITYEVAVYDKSDIQQMLEQLKLLLERVVANPDERIETLTLGLGDHWQTK